LKKAKISQAQIDEPPRGQHMRTTDGATAILASDHRQKSFVELFERQLLTEAKLLHIWLFTSGAGFCPTRLRLFNR
jgi:hypothetical protein